MRIYGGMRKRVHKLANGQTRPVASRIRLTRLRSVIFTSKYRSISCKIRLFPGRNLSEFTFSSTCRVRIAFIVNYLFCSKYYRFFYIRKDLCLSCYF